MSGSQLTEKIFHIFRTGTQTKNIHMQTQNNINKNVKLISSRVKFSYIG